MPDLTLYAPLRGWCTSLDEVPDAVFAERMLGDGVAIDPTGDTLCAPCDGVVASIAPSRHAVVIRCANGAELLLHVGIDTVAQGGAGFEPLIEAGARVRTGDPLLRFDLDVIANAGRSLLTPIVVTGGERFDVVAPRIGRAVDVGDPLLVLRPATGRASDAAVATGPERSVHLPVAFEHGIHARPAARIAGLAKSIAADITVTVHGRRANARSATALMSLGARRGDELTFTASGPDAAVALETFRRGVLELPDSLPAEGTMSPQPDPSAPIVAGDHLRGVIASRGFAVGRAAPLTRAPIDVEETGRGIARERAALDRALADVAAHVEELAASAGAAARQVIAAHVELLADPLLIASARRTISAGRSAAFAWRQAIRESADLLRGLGDTRLAERIDDLLDLESQVLRALGGEAPAAGVDLPDRAILLAEDLTPSQLLALDADRLAGLCTVHGGATSHVAILAASMGVPALAALGPALRGIDEGAWLVLDADQGRLLVAPDDDALAAAERLATLHAQRAQAERAAASCECHTADGSRIEVLANLGSAGEAELAVAQGAEGCGLLRSEFLFLDRDRPPDEDEQHRAYHRIAHALGGRPLTVRTLDVGGDKPIPYLPLPEEHNPALGLRGLRAALSRPDLLSTQLRAILRVEPAGQCRVLLPMVTDVAEIRCVRSLLEAAQLELGRSRAVPLGAMIETPASALLADSIAGAVDFLSIGTNDLTQYTLAMDREHAALADRLDGAHPAVLRLIGMTADAAARHGRPVSVCGSLAADPDVVPLLLGLGVTTLSVVAAAVPPIKSRIRALTMDACRALAERAVALETGAAVREMLRQDASATRSKVMP